MTFRPMILPQSANWDYRLTAEDFNTIILRQHPHNPEAKFLVLLASKPDPRGEGVIMIFDNDEGGEKVRAEYKSLHRGDKFDGVVLHRIWWETGGGIGIAVGDVNVARSALIEFTNVMTGTDLPEPDGTIYPLVDWQPM